MIRAENLFAGAAITLLILGLVLPNILKTTQHMTVTWPGSTFMIGYQVPCFGLAALFAAFACSYALRWIRLSAATADWHLWLSLSGVAIFGFGFALFARIAVDGAGRQSGQGALLAIAAGLLVGPAVFVAGQLVFLAAMIRSFIGQRR
ncbi:MAG TPA: hypothetical protein VJV22_03590 [Acidobacteriaceae bacterium]|nr:hypothetical protein [Acidobacteriaceae bacterium]